MPQRRTKSLQILGAGFNRSNTRGTIDISIEGFVNQADAEIGQIDRSLDSIVNMELHRTYARYNGPESRSKIYYLIVRSDQHVNLIINTLNRHDVVLPTGFRRGLETIVDNYNNNAGNRH